MNEYILKVKDVKKEIAYGQLQMSGTSSSGESIDFNSYSMIKNGKPFYSITGEFHFSRYPCERWEEEILKIKACGLDTIAAYMFWIHHEFIEGEFDFTGNNDVRRFVQICGKHNINVILRIGPYAHGECRNGGLPDWLFGRPFEVRSNDEGYLYYVNRYFEQIGKQVSDLMFKDSGPVIAIQLENEYMAACSPWEITTSHKLEWITHGNGGKKHMEALYSIAQKHGMITPFVTFTAWGDSPYIDNKMLPLWGCYAYWPWLYWTDTDIEHPPTWGYIFENHHNKEKNKFFEKYPYACGEMGGGMQVFYPYRFIVEPESVEAMSLINIAGGCNVLGYFMFHGGRNPIIHNNYINEKLCPRISYDFQAPLGDFGVPKNSYKRIKLLHYMLRDFNDFFCASASVVQNEAIVPENKETLRYAARTDGNRSFLFINNYQDHLQLPARENQSITLETNSGNIRVPFEGGIHIEENASMVLPVMFELESLLLQYATSQYITKINSDEGTAYFFFNHHGLDGELCFKGDVDISDTDNVTVSKHNDITIVKTDNTKRCHFKANGIKFIILTRKESFDFWKVTLKDKDYAILSDANISFTDNQLRLENIGAKDLYICSYPKLPENIGGVHKTNTVNELHSYTIICDRPNIHMSYDLPYNNRALLHIDTSEFDKCSEVFLKIDYYADEGWAFIDGKLIHDDMYKGDEWTIGLKDVKELLDKNEMYIYLSPISDDRKVNIESTSTYAKVSTDNSAQAQFNSISIIPEITVTLDF